MAVYLIGYCIDIKFVSEFEVMEEVGLVDLEVENDIVEE